MDNGNLHNKEGLEWRQFCKGPGGSQENISPWKSFSITICIYYALGESKVGSTSGPDVMLVKKKAGCLDTENGSHLLWLWPGGRSERLQSTSWISPSDQMHSWKPIKEQNCITHTRQHWMSSVCDRVHDEEGDDISVQTECIVQPALQ